MATNYAPSKQPNSSEEWVCIQSLGSGSYGDVHLYKNVKSCEKIAVKRFKGKLQDGKNCHRWMKEVKILKTLDHCNIVKAFDVPEQLADPTNHHPLLATEYCEGGNLRKVIGRIYHLSGLSRKDVCDILSQIANGLLYLHEKDIIHRDLKPENIVLKPTENEIIYKIIDLGFAKDLGNESASSSFAGTQVYADPYLHVKLQYDKAVDYWSMGVLCFELITGRRPFSPIEHSPCVPFYNRMKERPSSCVCMMQDINGKTEFSGNIPRTNFLSRDSVKSFEIWLRNMFLHDRSRRGLIILDNGSSVHWHKYLKEVTNMKEYKVLNMATNKVLTYRSDEVTSMRILQEHLAEEDEAHIPLESQLLLLADGQVAPPAGVPSVRKMHNASENEEFPDYFLFDMSVRHCTSNSANHSSMVLPPLAKAVVDSPSTNVEGKKILRRVWAELLYVCRKEGMKAAWALEGVTALKRHYEKKTSKVADHSRQLASVLDNLVGMCDMFQTSVTEDLRNYDIQVDCGIYSDEMFSKWIESKEKFCNIPDDLKQRIRNIISCKEVLSTGSEFLREEPTQNARLEELRRCERRSLELYARAAEEWRNQKDDVPVKCSNWKEIVTCMEKSRKVRQDLGKDVAKSVGNILQILQRNNPDEVRKEMDHVTTLLKEHKEMLEKAQRERQKDIWTSIGYVYEQLKVLKYESVQGRFLSLDMPPNDPSTLNFQEVNESLGRSFSVASPESLRTLEDSVSTREEFTEAVDRFSTESSDRLRELEGLNWEFGEPA